MIKMANRYFVKRPWGHWNTTNSWSATSGGATGASIPATQDKSLFDTSSGSCVIAQDTDVRAIQTTSGWNSRIVVQGDGTEFRIESTFTMPNGLLRFSGGATSWRLGSTTVACQVTMNSSFADVQWIGHSTTSSAGYVYSPHVSYPAVFLSGVGVDPTIHPTWYSTDSTGVVRLQNLDFDGSVLLGSTSTYMDWRLEDLYSASLATHGTIDFKNAEFLYGVNDVTMEAGTRMRITGNDNRLRVGFGSTLTCNGTSGSHCVITSETVTSLGWYLTIQGTATFSYTDIENYNYDSIQVPRAYWNSSNLTLTSYNNKKWAMVGKATFISLDRTEFGDMYFTISKGTYTVAPTTSTYSNPNQFTFLQAPTEGETIVSPVISEQFILGRDKGRVNLLGYNSIHNNLSGIFQSKTANKWLIQDLYDIMRDGKTWSFWSPDPNIVSLADCKLIDVRRPRRGGWVHYDYELEIVEAG